MANPLRILVAGRHADIVPVVVRLLHNNPEWTAAGALTNEEAMQYMNQHCVNVLLLSSGLTVNDEHVLKLQLAACNPQAITIQHYGGGSGLLVAEIYEALTSSR